VLLLAQVRPGVAADAELAIPQPYRSVANGLPIVPFGVGTGARVRADGAALVPPLHWDVQAQDRTLAAALRRWAGQAGYRVDWDVPGDVPVDGFGSFEGTFEAVLESVLQSPQVHEHGGPLDACIYAGAPPVVRITRRGVQDRACTAN
jgi:hypothetical protein